MFVNKNIDTMLQELENPRLAFYVHHTGYTVGEALTLKKDDLTWVNHPGKIFKQLTVYLEDIRKDTILFPPLAEIIGNANRHGNYDPTGRGRNGDILKTLTVKVFEGDNGLAVRVRNQGEGFDYENVIDNFKKKLPYTQNVLGGCGTRMLALPGWEVSYEDKGRATNFLCLY